MKINPRKTVLALVLGLSLELALGAGHAEVIGHMTAGEPVTEARLAAVPAAERAAWREYLARSQALMAADKAALAAERAAGTPPETAGAHLKGEDGMPLKKPAAWYATAEARHVADNIVSFQTPAGGWGKNVNRSGPARQRGEHYAPVDDDPSGGIISGAKGWSYVGTIDNDATITELKFLARVQAALPGAQADQYRATFAKGVNYLLAAQYPNGGFPQVFPLQGGYHDAITFNDNAIAQVVELLDDVAARKDDYAFVPSDLAGRALAAKERAVKMILATQIVVDGVRTGWCQQHDALTLAPVGARNFEPVAISSGETARLLAVLMKQPSSPPIVSAIDAGAAWLKKVAVYDVEYTRKTDAKDDGGRRLVARPGAGPLWSRLYDVKTMKPVFGDRDKSIHTDVNELSVERRNGYGWYGNGPAATLAAYDKWAAKKRATS
ncbi:PelA/Pel-15E family pectate lyase [Pseudoduganella lurida]|uniref:PelA/Pel-15E family pectate lyase n=1 Tax=Pseudoduganella lurida TaxID=1036180 RepID=A0A562RML8_9BURK|nr:pectate lyase [Pseudoduganella lurida]TWI69696.1 PelA/Pel-15E family pectate lyase [Pseudoduganella lurida]